LYFSQERHFSNKNSTANDQHTKNNEVEQTIEKRKREHSPNKRKHKRCRIFVSFDIAA
jgi:hypothetical protein